MAQGTLLIAEQRCKGCGLCIAACPQAVLTFAPGLNTHGYHPVMLKEPSLDSAAACTGCALCALVCPDCVFTVFRESPPSRSHGARALVGAPVVQRGHGAP